jgi:hypothetical protein
MVACLLVASRVLRSPDERTLARSSAHPRVPMKSAVEFAQANRDGNPQLVAGVVLRSPGQVRTGWIFGLFCVVLGVVEAIARGDTIFLILSGLGGVHLIVLFAWRTGVWIGTGGIRVRNPLTSFDLDWREIKSFRIGRHGPYRACCLMELKDGSTRYAFAIQVSNWSIGKPRPDTPEGRMVSALNAALERNNTTA